MTEPTYLGYGRGGQQARMLKDGKAADAQDLRAELNSLGVVRDEGGKQYWRRADRPVES